MKLDLTNELAKIFYIYYCPDLYLKKFSIYIILYILGSKLDHVIRSIIRNLKDTEPPNKAIIYYIK